MEKKYVPTYICWHENDFMADRAVMRMTPHQRLMYRALCQAAMFCDWRPYLPDDDEELYLLADADSLEQWKANRAAVLLKFTPETIDGKALLSHKRLLHDWDRHVALSEIQRQRGQAGAAKRWGLIAPDSQSIAPAIHELAPASQRIAPDGKLNKIKENKSSEMLGAMRLEIVFPDWLPSDKWKEYVEMRQRIRKPMTQKAVQLAIAKLAGLRALGYDVSAVLEQSVFNSWQGLFAPSTDPRKTSPSPQIQVDLTEATRRQRGH